MPEENVTTKFRVDISDLKKGITDANRQIQLATAEFKKATAGLDDWTKSADGLTAKIEQQNKIIDQEKKKLDLLKQQLDRLNKAQQDGEKIIAGLTEKYNEAVKTYGETSDEAKAYAKQLNDAQAAQERNTKAAENLNLKIINQEAATIKAEAQAEKYKTALNDLEKSEQEAAKEAARLAREQEEAANSAETITEKVQRQQAELADLRQKYIDVAAAQGKDSSEAQELGRKIDELSSDLRENRNALENAERSADDFDNSLEDVGDEAETTAKGGLQVFAVALGNLIANVVSAAIDKLKDLARETIEVGKAFDGSMSQVEAVSGATGNELEQLREKAKEMGATTKFSASEAADAFNYMAMAGWKTEDMLDGIEGVLNLAAASGSDLATTSDIVTDALTAMGYSAGDAGKLADVMAAASSNANTNVEMMGETFKYAAPIVGALGYSMEDTAVAIGLMANAGIKAEQAGTSLRAVLTRLSAPPKDCADEMTALGLSMTDSEGRMKSLDEVMKDLRRAFGGLSETEQTAAAKHIAGANAMSGLLAIVNAAPEDFEKLTEAVAHSGGTADMTTEQLANMAEEMLYNFERMGGDAAKFQNEMQKYLYFEYDLSDAAAQEVIARFMASMENGVTSADDLAAALAGVDGAAGNMADTMLNNLGGDMTLLSSKLESVQLALYEKFEPALRKGVEALDKLLDVVQYLIDHGDEVISVLSGMAAGIAAYVAYTTALKVMQDGWMALTVVQEAAAVAQWALNKAQAANPIGLVIAAVVTLVAAFISLWKRSEKFRNFWIGLWETIKTVAGAAWETIKEFFSNAWETIEAVWNGASTFFSTVWDGIKTVFSTVATWINTHIFQPIINFFKPVINFYVSAWKIIFELARGAWEGVKVIWGIVSGWFKKYVIDPIVAYYTALWNGIKIAASTAWAFIKGVWAVVSTWFNSTIIQPVSKFFSGMWEKLKSGAKDAWEGIKSVFGVVSDWFKNTFSDAWQKVKDVFSTGGKVFDGIKDGIVSAFKVVVNAIIRGINRVIAVPFNAINGVLDRISNVDIAGFKPFSGLITRLPVPQIPQLAQGGIVDKRTLATIGEDGAEAVLPLEKNKGGLKKIARLLAGEMKSGGAFGGNGNGGGKTQGGDTIYNFNQTNNSPKSLSRYDIYRQTKNLMNALKIKDPQGV